MRNAIVIHIVKNLNSKLCLNYGAFKSYLEAEWQIEIASEFSLRPSFRVVGVSDKIWWMQ